MKQIKIKSISKIEHNSKRYDISVADNNNLFANDILIHNCQSATFTSKIVPRFNNWFGRKMFNLVQKWQ